MSAWPRTLRATLVVAALCSGIGAGWLLDHAGRLPEPRGAQVEGRAARDLAQRRIADAPTWLIGLGMAFLVGLPVALVSRQLQRIFAVQRIATLHSIASNAAVWRDSRATRLTSLHEVERAVAQLVADALGCAVQVRPGCLMADELPAPYLTVTDMSGTRYLLTAHRDIFVRSRLVQPHAVQANLSTLSPLAHAELQAVWDAVHRLKLLTQVATPAGGDWRVFVLSPARARQSIVQQLRASWRRRALLRLPSRAAELAPVLRVVLPERHARELRVAQRQLPEAGSCGQPVSMPLPGSPAADGGDA